MMSEALKALLDYEQADADGTMVRVSRQAVHEVADEIVRLNTEIERLRMALWDIHAICNGRPIALWVHHRIKKMVRIALKRPGAAS